jgi:hypothetical protein
MKPVSSALLVCLLAVSACSDEAADSNPSSTTGPSTPTSQTTLVDYAASLTEEEIEWCTFPDSSEASADRFDQIFQAGLNLGLEMDSLNAIAQASLDDLMAQGMARDEATAAVSQDLFGYEAFTLACHEAFVVANGG